MGVSWGPPRSMASFKVFFAFPPLGGYHWAAPNHRGRGLGLGAVAWLAGSGSGEHARFW